jgi:hypothetical protein
VCKPVGHFIKLTGFGPVGGPIFNKGAKILIDSSG